MDDDSDWRETRFHWEQLKHLVVEATILYRGTVRPAGVNQEGVRPFYAWWWILEGHVTVEIPGSRFHAQPGHWILIPAGVSRKQVFLPTTRLLSINFIAHWGRGAGLLQVPALVTGDRNTVRGLVDAAERACDAAQPSAEDGAAALRSRRLSVPDYLTLQSELHRFVTLLFNHATTKGGVLPSKGSGDGRLDRILESLRSAPRAGPLPFSEWQRVTGLGRSQLDRIARKKLGKSLRKHRDDLLLEEACRRLAAGAPSVKQLASELGFADATHFSRWVRTQTSHPPGFFRQLEV